MYKQCLFFKKKRLRWRELTMLCIVLSVYTNFQVDISKHIEFADSSRQMGVGNCISSRDKKRNLLSHSQYDDMCLSIWWIMLKCTNVLNAFIFPCLFSARKILASSPEEWVANTLTVFLSAKPDICYNISEANVVAMCCVGGLLATMTCVKTRNNMEY